ncbi:MAG: hypothetical protein LC687_07880 [Actinobacteria bacterium]|nr:hypothetical protein [Actinomycetota bacterium]
MPIMAVPLTDRAVQSAVVLGFLPDRAVGFIGGQDVADHLLNLAQGDYMFWATNPLHPLCAVQEITCTADGAVLH